MISFCLLTPTLRIQHGVRAPSLLWNRNCWSLVGAWNRDERGASESTAWRLACTFQVKEQRCWAKVWGDKDRTIMAYGGVASRVSDWRLFFSGWRGGSSQRVPTSKKDALDPTSFYLALYSLSLWLLSTVIQNPASGFKSRKISLAFIHLSEIFLTQCRWGFL